MKKKLSLELWHRGLRYRKNDRSVFGTPDLTFKKMKIAVFADSEFWHGKDWEIRKNDHKTNKKFWHDKIEKNIKRDKLVNKTLQENGWIVIRFWGADILRNVEACADQIEKEINSNKVEI